MAARRYLIAAVGALGVTTAAPASIIFLSNVSSDETDAALLSASMAFSISGTTLTLTVTNNTADPNAYHMNELYFNAPDDVTLSFNGVVGWTMLTDQSANGFGTFDFALIDGTGNDKDQIAPAESVDFTFAILSGTPTMDDFVTLFSTLPPGDMAARVAAKFVRGPGDDSAFGANIPAPGVLALLGAASLAGGRRRRRRR